jgi:hypothetical protein
VTVAVVALTYLAGKFAYRIRDVLLMLMVAGFIAVILNPLAVALAALLSIPVAGALQVIARELWQATAWPGPGRDRPTANHHPNGARGP